MGLSKQQFISVQADLGGPPASWPRAQVEINQAVDAGNDTFIGQVGVANGDPGVAIPMLRFPQRPGQHDGSAESVLQ
jgi:hypothetical protein